MCAWVVNKREMILNSQIKKAKSKTRTKLNTHSGQVLVTAQLELENINLEWTKS